MSESERIAGVPYLYVDSTSFALLVFFPCLFLVVNKDKIWRQNGCTTTLSKMKDEEAVLLCS